MMPITMDEANELSRIELEARLSALLAEDMGDYDEPYPQFATLASIEVMSTALARKLPAAEPWPENHWL